MGVSDGNGQGSPERFHTWCSVFDRDGNGGTVRAANGQGFDPGESYSRKKAIKLEYPIYGDGYWE